MLSNIFTPSSLLLGLSRPIRQDPAHIWTSTSNSQVPPNLHWGNSEIQLEVNSNQLYLFTFSEFRVFLTSFQITHLGIHSPARPLGTNSHDFGAMAQSR